MQIDDNSSLDAMRLMADWRLAPREERLRVQPSVVTDLLGDRLELIDLSRHESGICKYKIRKRRWKAVCYAINHLFQARLLSELDSSQRSALCCWTATMTRKGMFAVNPLLETIRVYFSTFAIDRPYEMVQYHVDLHYDHLTILGEFAHQIDANTLPCRRYKLVEDPYSARMDCQRFPRIPVHIWVKENPEPWVVYTRLRTTGPHVLGPPPPAESATPMSPRKDAVSPRPLRQQARRGSIMPPAQPNDFEPIALTSSAEFRDVVDLLLEE